MNLPVNRHLACHERCQSTQRQRGNYCVVACEKLDSSSFEQQDNAAEQVSQAARPERIAEADSPSASGIESATSAGCLPAPAAPSSYGHGFGGMLEHIGPDPAPVRSIKPKE